MFTLSNMNTDISDIDDIQIKGYTHVVVFVSFIVIINLLNFYQSLNTFSGIAKLITSLAISFIFYTLLGRSFIMVALSLRKKTNKWFYWSKIKSLQETNNSNIENVKNSIYQLNNLKFTVLFYLLGLFYAYFCAILSLLITR